MISLAPVDTRDQLGVSQNMSTGGIRFEVVGCEIELGEALRVTFNVGDQQTVVAIGRVAWLTKIDPITLDVGLEFVEIDPEAVDMLNDVTATETG
jgi:hypothetical protein